ncbi:MAG: 3-isopropylmalate dehydratase [archaeon]|nr:3-isopropylmalate dehydratase [archaeon]
MSELIGNIWKFGDNINTDLIVPSKYLTVNDPKIIINHAFDGVIPGFSEIVKKGDIIVGGKNFGSGSSREEAVFVVKELGISAIIAESFSRIYFRNLINNGIPAITLNDATSLFEQGEQIKIDMKSGKIQNLSIKKEINFIPLPEFIMNLIDNGGTLNIIKKSVNSK